LRGSALLALLHVCDSLFPIGGFSCSDGLEHATASGAVATPDGLREWMDVCLDESLLNMDGPTVWLAWSAFLEQDWGPLLRLDEEVTALRPSGTTRRASRAMGLRLITAWQTLYPDPGLVRLAEHARDGAVGPAWPVAFASVCAASGVDRRSTLEAFAYNRLAATVSAAMRLMPIGQAGAHALLAEALVRVPAMADAVIVRTRPVESFAPAMDLAAMSQQYLHSRLFRS
jgi:urease accessory protein